MKAAIFDVDGTLIDSMGVWLEVTKAFFENHGLTLTPELAARYQEMTLEESLPEINSMFDLGLDFDNMYNEFAGRVGDEYKYRIPAKPGAVEYVKQLYEGGIKIAAATSGYEELCRAVLERLGILDCFSVILFSSDIGESKESGKIYLKAAEALGVEKEDCMVYEDILAGVKGAKKAGIPVTAVADKSNLGITQALKQHSDHYITGWQELLKR